MTFGINCHCRTEKLKGTAKPNYRKFTQLVPPVTSKPLWQVCEDVAVTIICDKTKKMRTSPPARRKRSHYGNTNISKKSDQSN